MSSEKQFIARQHEVRSILENKQSTFSRVVKPYPLVKTTNYSHVERVGNHHHIIGKIKATKEPVMFTVTSKYSIGDLLYLKETWRIADNLVLGYELGNDHDRKIDTCRYVQFKCGGAVYETNGETIQIYSEYESILDSSWNTHKKYGTWKSSVCMPKWASRIQLRVTDIFVERLHDVYLSDPEHMIDEGIKMQELDGQIVAFNGLDTITCDLSGDEDIDYDNYYRTVKTCFALLWDRKNKKNGYGWDMNPFVEVVVVETE